MKDYARNHKKSKDYVQQPDLLMAGVDVSKVKHDACMGTLAEISVGSWDSRIHVMDLSGLNTL